MMSTGRGAQRTVVRHHISSEALGAIVLGAITAVAVCTALAGQLATMLSGFGWPSWSRVGLNFFKPIVSVYIHPSAPLRDWPGLGAHPAPAAWLYWTIYGLVIATLLVIVVWAWWHARRQAGRPGFANRAEVAAELGADALVKQAPRLRPQLAMTTPRPDPRALGTYRGRDIFTGIDTYSSVRKSTYVLGPSESGKTSCVAIPEALDHDGPLLTPSSRADVMAATWKTRADLGRVQLFDPLQDAPGLPLLRWQLVRRCIDTSTALNRAQSLTASIDMSGVSNGDSWKNRGQSVLRNLLHAAALDHKDIRTVLRWTYDQTSVEPAAILERGGPAAQSWAEMHRQVTRLPERQRAGYYMAVEAAMSPFEHPAVLDACTPRGTENFDAEFLFDPANGYPTVYLLAQAEQAVAVVDLLGALMDEIITLARTRAQRSRNNRLDPALKFLVDEATNTATLKQMPALISGGSGAGIPTTMIVQERAQAIERWGPNNATAMWGAASLRMVLPGVSDPEQLRTIASYAGEFDEELPRLSQSTTGNSVSYDVRIRQGMQPDEVRALPKRHGLLLAGGGLRPVLTELEPYYQRRDAGYTAASEKEFFDALDDHRSAL